MVCALRLKVPAGSWQRQLVYEIVAGLSVVLLIAWLLFQFIHLLAPAARLDQMYSASTPRARSTVRKI